MRSLKNFTLAAIMAGFIPQASAVDLSTYPVSLLGPVKDTKPSLVKGTTACKMTGTLMQNGAPVYYSGHVRLTHDGKEEVVEGAKTGFGRFTSAAGKESFVQYSIPYSMSNGDGSFTNGGFTCMHLLDVSTSKYAVNKNGLGISELHWNADANNPNLCPAFVDQMGWIVDRAGHTYTTKFNEASTVQAAQSVECSPAR